MSGALLDALAITGIGLAGRRVRITVEQLLICSFKSEKIRRIQRVGEIHANRADGRLVANAEARRVHHVVEILKIFLVIAKREIT